MSEENCNICNKISTPWVYDEELSAHICQDCFINAMTPVKIIYEKHKAWLIKNYTETQALIRVEPSYTKRAEMAKKEAFLKMVIDNLKALEDENK